MIQIVLKKHRVTHESQGTDMSSMNKGAGTYNLKKGCGMNGKNDLEESLRRKPVYFSLKNTANNVDTWGFIQQFFQHLYRTANSIVHLIVWTETA